MLLNLRITVYYLLFIYSKYLLLSIFYNKNNRTNKIKYFRNNKFNEYTLCMYLIFIFKICFIEIGYKY